MRRIMRGGTVKGSTVGLSYGTFPEWHAGNPSYTHFYGHYVLRP